MLLRITGLLLLISGLFLFYLAYQGSETLGDETKHFFTGDYRDRTYWLIGGAIAGFVVPLRRRPLFG